MMLEGLKQIAMKRSLSMGMSRESPLVMVERRMARKIYVIMLDYTSAQCHFTE